MIIAVTKQAARRVVAYKGIATGNIYLKAADGRVITVSLKGRHEKQAGLFTALALNTSAHEPLYEGDVVEITL